MALAEALSLRDLSQLLCRMIVLVEACLQTRKKPALGLAEALSPRALHRLHCKRKLSGEGFLTDKPGKRPALRLAEVPAPEEFCKLNLKNPSAFYGKNFKGAYTNSPIPRTPTFKTYSIELLKKW